MRSLATCVSTLQKRGVAWATSEVNMAKWLLSGARGLLSNPLLSAGWAVVGMTAAVAGEEPRVETWEAP